MLPAAGGEGEEFLFKSKVFHVKRLQIDPSIYRESIERIKALVQESFLVSEISYVEGVLTFKLKDNWIKEEFKRLYLRLAKMGFLPVAERRDGGILLRIYPYRPPERKASKIPLMLLIATFATVFVDGYLRSTVLSPPIPGAPQGLSEALRSTVLFTVSIMAIIGIHELGHKLSARIDGIDSSLPYFIPGIPGQLPTFGAVIFQRSPIANRDDLFDLGISGPVAGFFVSLVVLYLSYESAIWLPVEEARRVIESLLEGQVSFLPRPIIYDLVGILLSRPGMVPLIPPTPFGLAAWLGMLVTGLNMLPVWQLDGGRIFRSLTTLRTHRILSYASVLILIVTGYLLLAILLLLMMRNTIDVAPLDGVSPLSAWRKLGLIGGLAMTVLTFVVLPNSFLPL